jgi:hypothetical protein
MHGVENAAISHLFQITPFVPKRISADILLLALGSGAPSHLESYKKTKVASFL